MVDYLSVLERTLKGFENPDASLRAKLYERARTTIRRQFENKNPPVEENIIVEEMNRLETAIITVEENYSNVAATPDVNVPPLTAPVDIAPKVNIPAPPVAEPVTGSPVAEPVEEKLPADAQVAPVEAPVAPAVNVAPPVLDSPVVDLPAVESEDVSAPNLRAQPEESTPNLQAQPEESMPSLQAQPEEIVAPAADAPTVEVATPPSPPEGGGSRKKIFLLLALVLLFVAGFVFWQFVNNQTPSEISTRQPVIEQPAPEQSPQLAEPKQVETTSISRQNNNTTNIAPTNSRAILYETGSDGKVDQALNGTIQWSATPQPLESGGPSRKQVIHGRVEIAARDMVVFINIANHDYQQLPASHLIDLTFVLPKQNETIANGVDNVNQFILKESESDVGKVLDATATKIDDGIFLLALNNLQQSRQDNEDLLLEKTWIDIPIQYSNGSRALISLEKGTSGQRIFETVFATWVDG